MSWWALTGSAKRSPTRTSSDQVRFFIRRTPGGEFTDWLFIEDRMRTRLRVRRRWQPLVAPGGAPVLCVAGRSGLAPVRDVLEAAYDNDVARFYVLAFGAAGISTAPTSYGNCLRGWFGQGDRYPVLMVGMPGNEVSNSARDGAYEPLGMQFA
jgi:p-cymene monooxygenase electron transfer component